VDVFVVDLCEKLENVFANFFARFFWLQIKKFVAENSDVAVVDVFFGKIDVDY
jgi:hypothetical protein